MTITLSCSSRALKPAQVQRQKRGDTVEKPRGDGARDGREAATSPGMDAQSPQKLEEAGRTLLCTLHEGAVHTWPTLQYAVTPE